MEHQFKTNTPFLKQHMGAQLCPKAFSSIWKFSLKFPGSAGKPLHNNPCKGKGWLLEHFWNKDWQSDPFQETDCSKDCYRMSLRFSPEEQNHPGGVFSLLVTTVIRGSVQESNWWPREGKEKEKDPHRKLY